MVHHDMFVSVRDGIAEVVKKEGNRVRRKGKWARRMARRLVGGCSGGWRARGRGRKEDRKNTFGGGGWEN